ncbi:MAG: hypothetical protein MI975_02075, partial [Cytophagales bacterium]|nr:hypothetical protein [Cytophagales bacterium]
RGMEQNKARHGLEQQINAITQNESLWLVDDHEPLNCYDYLIKRGIFFQTFIISENEYRVFISNY